jgi:hypothetical protein
MIPEKKAYLTMSEHPPRIRWPIWLAAALAVVMGALWLIRLALEAFFIGS